MPRQVLGLKILPDVDRQGMSRVMRTIKDALGKGVIDASTAKNFGSMAANAAKEFNSVVAQAKMVGLHKEADKWAARWTATQDELASTVAKMGELQQKVGKEITQEQYAAAQREMKERMDGLNARISAEMSATQRIIDTRKRAIEEIEGRTSIEGGRAMAEAFGDSVTDIWNKFTARDFEGLAKGLSGALQKAGTSLEARAAMGGGGGAGAATAGLGKSLVTLAGAAATLAAVVAAFAAIAKVAMDADAQAKEFNGTLLKGASAADFTTKVGVDGFSNLTQHLDNAREAAFGLAYQFRTTPKEIMGIVSAANEAGLTFKEMQRFVGGNVDEMRAFTEISRTALVYSKQLGQELDTVASQSAEWAHDLGMGLKDVRAGFDEIFTGAMQSGIGVKRFYSMVTIATSNLALYNARVEEAAGLISTLAKSLGETNAAEFVKGLTKGFADESYTQRFKRAILAGSGDMREIMGNSAKDTAKAFSEKFGADIGPETQKALDAAHIDLSAVLRGDTKALTQLGQMSEDQIRSVLQTAKTPEQYRELEKLVNLTQGMSGNLSDQTKALDALDMGGKLATILAGGLGGKELSKMSAIELAAFEGYAGISGEQLVILRKMDRQLRGEFSEIQAAKEATQKGTTLTATQQDLLKRQHIEMRKDNDGIAHAFVAGTTKQLDSFNDYAQSQGDLLKAAVGKDQLSAQEAMAQEIVSNTASISSWLETGMQQGLEKIADLLQMIYDAVSHVDPRLREAKDKIVDSIETEQSALMAAQGEAKQVLSDLKVKYAQAQGDDRAALEKQIKEKEAEIARRNDLIGIRGQEAKTVRSQSTEGVISALWSEFKSGGKADTMVGAGLSAGFNPGEAGAAIGITGEGRTKKYFQDVGQEMTEAQHLTLSEAQKADLAAKNAAKKNEEDLKVIQDLLDKANTNAPMDIAQGLAMWDDPLMKATLQSNLAAQGTTPLQTPGVQDFLYRGGAMGGTVTPINQADQLLGAKPGGAVDKALGDARVVHNTFNINGGDTGKIYEVVKRVMRESGVRPPSGRG